MEVTARLAGALLALVCACLSADAGGRKDASYAIVEGTVFRDPGLAAPEVKVVLQLRDDPKAKKQEAVTSYRGEFQFHVPASAAVYVVKAARRGFHPDQKVATVAGGAAPGQERVEVNLLLLPESK